MINEDNKVLITGCGGMLGEAAYEYFKNICQVYPTDIDINEPWLSYLDVRNLEQLRSAALKIVPDYIFHLAALTDMEHCENDSVEAYRTNSNGTENAAIVCKELGIPIIYITTAGTFDGKQEAYTDYAIPNPLSIYGKSKYAGEVFIKQSLKEHFIFRPSWMIGGGPKKDKKFVNKIITQIKEGKKELFIVNDKFGTPTYTYDFVKVMHRVIDLGFYGVYNCACEGAVSRFDLANEILTLKKLNDKIKINPVNSSYFKEYFAARPKSEILINLKLKMLGININRDWKTCLAEYLSKHDWGI